MKGGENVMKTYEAPTVVELGDFHQETGEFRGDFVEQFLPLQDRSAPGS